MLDSNWSATGNIQATAGTLQLNGDGATLGVYSIRAASGAAVQYANATVNGGFLRGPGTHTTLPGTSNYFNGATTYASTIFLQNGTDTFTNFTNGGQVTNNAPLVWDGGENNIGGGLIVNSTLSADDFVNSGVVTINGGGAINNHLSDMTSGGGGRITINSGGTLNVNSQGEGTALDLQDSLLVNNGTVTGTTNVYYGATISGSGTFGTVNVLQGGDWSMSPNSIAQPASVLVNGGTINGGGATATPIAVEGLTVSATAASAILNLSGDLAGSGSVTASGPGTIVLSGTNSFTGGLQVDSGAAVLDGASSLSPGSSLTIGTATGAGAFLLRPPPLQMRRQQPNSLRCPSQERWLSRQSLVFWVRAFCGAVFSAGNCDSRHAKTAIS